MATFTGGPAAYAQAVAAAKAKQSDPAALAARSQAATAQMQKNGAPLDTTKLPPILGGTFNQSFGGSFGAAPPGSMMSPENIAATKDTNALANHGAVVIPGTVGPNMGGGNAGPPQMTGPGMSGQPNINSFYQDLMKNHNSRWQEQKQFLQNQAGQGQRMAALNNSRMGRSIGGGYSQLQGQAQIGSMNEMQKAWLANQEQSDALNKQYLDYQNDEFHRNQEHQWAVDSQNKSMANNLDIVNAQMGGNDPTNLAKKNAGPYVPKKPTDPWSPYK